jgi:hypothetical protein
MEYLDLQNFFLGLAATFMSMSPLQSLLNHWR